MRRLVLCLASVFLAFLVGQSQYIKKIEVTEGKLLRVTPALRDLPNTQLPSPSGITKLASEKNTEEEGVMKVYGTGEIPGGDPVLQRNKNNLNAPTGIEGITGANESTINKS